MTLQANKLAKKYRISEKDAEALVSAGYDSPAKIKAAKKTDLPAVGKSIVTDRYEVKKPA